MTDQKSVFISYAHKDGLDFTRRLSYALSMYMDVFWDRRLPATNYPKELEAQIESRDYLLLIMTPFSIASVWCQRELQHAEKYGKGIVLARIFTGEGTTDPQLISKYTFGDFTDDFDAGFRRITAMMLGTPLSSWEYMPSLEDKLLLRSLQRGHLPVAVSRNIAEWALIDVLWAYTEENYLNQLEVRQKVRLVRGTPRTPLGIIRVAIDLLEKFAELRDSSGSQIMTQIAEVTQTFKNKLLKVSENDPKKAGEIAFNILTNVYDILQSWGIARRDTYAIQYVTKYFYFDVAEKTRETINNYARRSKYLY